MTYYPPQFQYVAGIPTLDQQEKAATDARSHGGSAAELSLWRRGPFPTFHLVYLNDPRAHRIAERIKLDAEPTHPNAKHTEQNAKRTRPKADRTEPEKACAQPNVEPSLPKLADPRADESRVPWENMFTVLEANAKLNWVEGQIRAIRRRIGSLDPTLPELGDYGAITQEFFRMDDALKGLHRAVCRRPSGDRQPFESIMTRRFEKMQRAILALNAQLEKVDGSKTSNHNELKELDETLKQELSEIKKQRARLEAKQRARLELKTLELKKLKARKQPIGPDHPEKPNETRKR